MEVENPRADTEETRRLHQCEPIQPVADSTAVIALAAVPGGVAREERAAAGGGGGSGAAPSVAMAAAAVHVPVTEQSAGKRKRGRPPRGQAKAPPKLKKDEEDVCFICFDGGNLVLCDRRGCPKAYHPACIKRDEAFFRSKAQWNCGWHICSSCEKAAHFMCYTCTYSLCKVCIAEAEFSCVRGSKGLCTTCMKTIMLIEDITRGDKETVQVDFDDKSSWEYLFKVYWIYLKGKHALTLDELSNAQNPAKNGILFSKVQSSVRGYNTSKYKAAISDRSSKYILDYPTKSQAGRQRNISNEVAAQNVSIVGADRGISLPKGAQWASKELLDFIAHMKDGDTSILSQFDVQALLLEYIKRNNLRDPHRKSQIICDMRLGKLFGKACVAHFEMLKLLEYHFLIKEDSRLNNMPGEFAHISTSQVATEQSNEYQPAVFKDVRRRTRKKSSNAGPPANLNEYASIDVHNVNLIYLRRSLMEILIEDAGSFSEKVVNAVVRIRISSADQKQDMYRLVQVVGTRKAAVPYKVGLKTSDVMLEIINLDRKEAISIDAVSNQEFLEDECRRLHQSVKCGRAKRLTVGEIQEKAMALREVKLADCLESEILRLSHLRDRASEKGRKRELRECVEKLELLKTPEERRRRLHEIPEIHADPSMDSEESHKKKEDLLAMSSTNSRPAALCGASDTSNEAGSALQGTCEQNKTIQHMEVSNGSARDPTSEKSEAALANSTTVAWDKQGAIRSGPSVAALETLTSLLSAEIASANCVETEKIWNYQDPNGKIQGPFQMSQLRKWHTIGYFPPDLRIWRLNERQDDSLLLTDALHRLQKIEQPLHCGRDVTSSDVKVASDDSKIKLQGKSEGMDSSVDDKQNKKTSCNDAFANTNDGEKLKSDEHSSWNTPAGFADMNEEPAVSNLRRCDTSAHNKTWSEQAQVHDSPISPTLSGKPCDVLLNQQREGQEGSAHEYGQVENKYLRNFTVPQTNSGQNKEGAFDSSDHSGESSGESWKPQPQPQPQPSASDGSDKTSIVLKTSQRLDQQHENEFLDLPSPTPKQVDIDQNVKISENKVSMASDGPIQVSGLTGSSASSLVGSGSQHPDVAGELAGYSPNSDKPSVQEWDSSLVPEALLRLCEAANDHAATPTSNIGQLTHSSTSHQASDPANWQVLVSGPNEFSSLGEESVSDLLAEVDAMEFNGLPSPTSNMNCNSEFGEGMKSDCFNPMEVLSPLLEPGKSDALSSTGDLQLPFKSSMLDEPKPQDIIGADVLNDKTRSSGQSSTSAEVEGEMKPSEVSVNQWERGSGVEPPAPSCKSWETSTTDAGRPPVVKADNGWGPVYGNATLSQDGRQSETTDNGWGSIPGNTNSVWGGTHSETSENGWGPVLDLNWGGTACGNSNVAWETVLGTEQAADRNKATLTMNLNTPANQVSLSPALSRGTPSVNVDTTQIINQRTAAMSQGSSALNQGTLSINCDTPSVNWGSPDLNRGTPTVNPITAAVNQHTPALNQPILAVNQATPTGILGAGVSQPKYTGSGDRYSGTRDRGYQGRESSFVRNRPSWNRQSSFGGGGGSPRPLPRGQRICKFYESGRCKKGAFCDYLHP